LPYGILFFGPRICEKELNHKNGGGSEGNNIGLAVEFGVTF
jgi:hypothetical protein